MANEWTPVADAASSWTTASGATTSWNGVADGPNFWNNPTPPVGSFLILESGFYLLQEDGVGKFLLEVN